MYHALKSLIEVKEVKVICISCSFLYWTLVYHIHLKVQSMPCDSIIILLSDTDHWTKQRTELNCSYKQPLLFIYIILIMQLKWLISFIQWLTIVKTPILRSHWFRKYCVPILHGICTDIIGHTPQHLLGYDTEDQWTCGWLFSCKTLDTTMQCDNI